MLKKIGEWLVTKLLKTVTITVKLKGDDLKVTFELGDTTLIDVTKDMLKDGISQKLIN